MKDDYIKYLESTVELQAYRIQQLETLTIFKIAYQNSIHGIQLGKRWLAKHEHEIVNEIIESGALEHVVDELLKSFREAKAHPVSMTETPSANSD